MFCRRQLPVARHFPHLGTERGVNFSEARLTAARLFWSPSFLKNHRPLPRDVKWSEVTEWREVCGAPIRTILQMFHISILNTKYKTAHIGGSGLTFDWLKNPLKTSSVSVSKFPFCSRHGARAAGPREVCMWLCNRARDVPTTKWRRKLRSGLY